MLQPYRRDLIAAFGMVTLWTATTLAGPFLVRYGIDHGLKKDDGGALDAAVIGYVVVAIVSYVTYRFQVQLISPDRRVVPPRPAGAGVRPPAAPVDAVLRPREGRA